MKQARRRYCSVSCRDADPAYRAAVAVAQSNFNNSRRSSFEIDAYRELDIASVEYLPQHVVNGKFCVDAFVSGASLVIQFDGDYWHGNPARKSSRPLDRRQIQRMTLDRSQDAYCKAIGYRVVRIWESDFRRDANAVVERILRAVAGI